MAKKPKSFMDQMEEMLGDSFENTFITKEEPLQFISSGSVALDVSIGGGIPKGRTTVIDGPESSGKSTVALSICKHCIQDLGEKALYIDQENQMVRDYMLQLLGDADSSKLVLAKPGNSDDAFKMIEAAITTEEFGVIILDTVAALSPVEEQEKDFDKATMAIISKDLAKFFRRNATRLRTKKVAIVFINQVRDNIGAYIKSYTTPGGHALKHYASIIISMSKGQEMKAGNDSIGIVSKFVVKKNKIAPPYRTFFIPIIFGVGVDTLRDAVDYASELGIVQRAGPYYKYEDVTLGKGMLDAMAYLENNKEVLDKIVKACYNIVVKQKPEISIEESEVVDE